MNGLSIPDVNPSMPVMAKRGLIILVISEKENI